MPDKSKSLAKDIVVKVFPKPKPRPADKAGPRVYVSSVQVVRSPRKPDTGQTVAEDALSKPKAKPARKKPAAAKKSAAKTAKARKPSAKKSPAKKTSKSRKK